MKDKEIQDVKDVQEVQGSRDTEYQQEVLAIDYKEVLKSYAESAQNLGQIVWIDSISENSNKINIVRVLKDGTKQLFSVIVSEESELTMSK